MKTPRSGTAASSPKEQDLHRQLIEQFYSNSIKCYGVNSEQARMFAQHLSAYQGQSEQPIEYDSTLS